MDELQISGKRYISSRRVAKENGYHTDYIGQLIRAGKVKGQKVGRTWYVEATSFAAYLGQPDALPVNAAPAQGEAPAQVAEPVSPVLEEEASMREAEAASMPITRISVAPGYIPSAPVVPSVPQTTPSVAQPVAAPIALKEEPVARTAQVAPAPKDAQTFSVPLRKVSAIGTATGGLRYVSEASSLPEIRRVEAETRIEQAIAKEKEVELAPIAALPVRRSNPMRQLMLVGVVAVAVFAISATVSSGLFQTINIEQGNPASIGYALHW